MKPSAPKHVRDYHTLISLMMSSQTKDEVTHATLKSLVDEHDLSVEVIQKTPEETLNQWIKRVGFHNQKAKYIKKTTEILAEKYGGKVPNTFDDLIGLPGVGPKMAHLVLQEAFGKV
jgi:endonuclease-3